jgi:hypothetical protein
VLGVIWLSTESTSSDDSTQHFQKMWGEALGRADIPGFASHRVYISVALTGSLSHPWSAPLVMPLPALPGLCEPRAALSLA